MTKELLVQNLVFIHLIILLWEKNEKVQFEKLKF